MTNNIKSLRQYASELITQCYTGNDLISKINMVLAASFNDSEFYKNLSLFKSKIKRADTAFANNIITSEDYDVKITRIQRSILDIINDLDLNEISVKFEFHYKDGLIYFIQNSEKDFLYKYIGKLKNNLPEGFGIARYSNGNYFEGNFHKGNRNGKGILFDRNGIIEEEGVWKNDKFEDKNIVKFFPNVSIAANSINTIEIHGNTNYELLKYPNVKGEGLIAFPLEGDSMEPSFRAGDVIICKEINDFNQILNNHTYVVFHESKLALKKVQKVEGKLNHFILISENYLKHHPYPIHITKQSKFYKLVSQIKSFK